MSIALDNTGVSTFSGSGPYTLNFQASGTQRLLAVIACGMRNVTTSWSWSAATFNSVALTEQVVNERATTNRNVRTAVWTLVNPTAGGAYQLSVTPSVSLLAAVIAVISLTGVDQTTPIGNTGSHSQSGTAFTTSITTVANDAWLVGGAGIRNGTITWSPGTDVTETSEQATGSDATTTINMFAGYRSCSGAGSYAFASTASSSEMGVLAAVEVRPAAVVGGVVPVLFNHYQRMIHG